MKKIVNLEENDFTKDSLVKSLNIEGVDMLFSRENNEFSWSFELDGKIYGTKTIKEIKNKEDFEGMIDVLFQNSYESLQIINGCTTLQAREKLMKLYA